MTKIKIKSVMRLSLVLIAFLSGTFCSGRKTKQDMLETYSVLKSTDLSGFSWWRILERGDIMFGMYYEHKDSALYQYSSSGSVILMSKYARMSFYVNEDFDSLYMIDNDTTLQFDDGVEFLSRYSDKNINKLKSDIKSNYRTFKRLGLKEVNGYPWGELYDFQLGPCMELRRVGGANRNEDFYSKRGYVKLDANWYYLIDATCQQ